MTRGQPAPTALTIPAPPGKNRFGLNALIISLIGAQLTLAVAVVPLLVVPALGVLVLSLVLAIKGLTRPGLSRTTSVIALIVSIVFGLTAPTLFAIGSIAAIYNTTVSEQNRILRER